MDNPLKENIHQPVIAKICNEKFNGYAREEKRFTPYFDKDTSEQICCMVNKNWNDSKLEYSVLHDVFIFTRIGMRETYPAEQILTTDGIKKMYAIGRCVTRWRWEKV